MGKSAEIQILRAYAVLMVLFGHMPFKLPDILIHGYTGVSLFFVISGYVVTLTFTKKFPEVKELYNKKIHAHIQEFYIRRFFRIIPVALAWVFIYFITAQFINYKGGSYGDISRWANELKWFFSGFYNYFFAASHIPGLFGHYWSLAVETQFYLFLPFLLIIFRNKKQRVYLSIFSILLVTTFFRFITPPDSIGLLTHTQADALFMGVLIYTLFSEEKKDGDSWINLKINYKIQRPIKNILFALMVAALFILPSWFDGKLSPIYKYPIYTLISGLIVYLAQRNTGWASSNIPAVDRFLAYIGDRSYSLYVCHIILYSGVYYFLFNKYIEFIPSWIKSTSFGAASQVLFLFLAALFVSDISYRFLELPYINYGKYIINSLDKER